MTDAYDKLAKAIASLPLRVVSVANGKAEVTEMTTSVPLEQFVSIDGEPYETELVRSSGSEFRYKVRPVNDPVFDWEVKPSESIDNKV